jgi:vancomycin aglycone glucosyltransferase
MASQLEKLAPLAQGCDAIVASGVVPAVVGARSIAEKLGIYYVPVNYCPIYLPSPHHPPQPLPGRPLPAGVTDNRVLNEHSVQSFNALFGEPLNQHRASLGLPPVNDVRAHFVSDHPWLAADPILAPWQQPAELQVVQTGAWIFPDARPLAPELEAFLEAGTPPVFVGFGSMRPPKDFARIAIEAIRAQGRRVLIGRGWADLALIDGADDCFAIDEVNQQALFKRVAAVIHHGGAGTTTTATRAGVPQVVVAQFGDQPYFARRVAELGVGAAHDGPTPTVESLSLALSTVLTSEVRERATAVAGTIRTDGAEVAAKLLIEAVG